MTGAVDALSLLGVEDQLRLQFLTALRRKWATTLFVQLRGEYQAAVAVAGPPESRRAAAALIERCPTYRWFGWLERGGQKMKWQVITAIVAADREGLLATADAPGSRPALLDPGIRLPDWYTDWDIHCQPGGVWGDSASAISEI